MVIKFDNGDELHLDTTLTPLKLAIMLKNINTNEISKFIVVENTIINTERILFIGEEENENE